MNSQDFNFYDNIDSNQDPFYDWERLIINVGCRFDEIASPDDQIGNDTRKKVGNLIHEYIHYLQNFCTSWGAPIYTDFTLSLFKIGVSKNEEVLTVPINADNISNNLLKYGLQTRERVLRRLNAFGQCKTDLNIPPSKLHISGKKDCIVLSNGRLEVELGLKVIREHMAEMGTRLFLRMSDEEIHRRNEDIISQIKGIPFSKAPEYWIVFEYFYGHKKYSNLARGIFDLMQNCLVFLNPEKALVSFFTWLHKRKYTSKTEDFAYLVNNWKTNNVLKRYQSDLSKAITHCSEILKVTENAKSDHDLFKFAYNIINYALTNVQQTGGGMQLFKQTDDLSSVQFWKNLLLTYGTGFVCYLDNIVIHGSSNHQNTMQESFAFLASSSLVLKKLLDNKNPECPFLYDLPICKASWKDDIVCFKNPFSILEDEMGNACLFRNGVILLGMKDKLNF